MNSLDKIYDEFGSNVCLFPFLAGFYGVANNHSLTPCSLINGEEWAIEDQSILTSANTERWRGLRHNFIEGSCHTSAHCKNCSNAEANGGDSARKLNNQYFAEHLQLDIASELTTIINNDYKIDRIVSLDFFPSNYCNYSCIMCSGQASSSRRTFEIRVLGFEKTALSKQTNLADDFYNILETVEIINFTGGETVLQQQVHELIDYLIEKDLAKNITISLLTNASSYPIKLIDKFKQFKNVFYTISIDGVGDVIEYQRRGSIWNTVETNALQLHHDMGCVVNYVLTAINVFGFTEFLKWAYHNKIDKIFISTVFNIDFFSVIVIPDDIKQTLIKKLELEKLLYTDQCYIDLLDRVIDILNTMKFSPEDLTRFINRIRMEDIPSKKPLSQIVPEWAPYFK
jgi:hypothetical protein